MSSATVSRVINAPHRVKPATRARVEAVVAELGYTPHFGGRALASNRTNTVGAIIPTMENAIFARGMQSLQEELSAGGSTLLVATSNYDPAEELQQIRTLLGRGVDGLILIGEAREPDVYAFLEARGLPFVLMWTWDSDSRWPCVGFDNRAAARRMADRVLDFGHTDIGMVAGVTRGNDRAEQRVAGVRDALEARGLRLTPERTVEAVYSLDAGAEAATRLLSLDAPPTAIMCGNDVLAAGACMAVRAAGLSAPGDVSLTGFDDIELARALDPQLTTVHVPHRRMGASAARILLSLCGRRGTPEGDWRVAYDVEVIERASLIRR